MLKAALERDTHNRPFEKTIKQFGEIVMSEPELMAKLERTYDANSFIATYCSLASERGIHFTADDMRIVVQEQKQGKDWVIPKAVLNLVRERF
jgi:pectin methylesterase-like acyl-CoA thioesterase